MGGQHAAKRRIRASWMVAALAALVGAGVVPLAGVTPAAAAVPRCGDVAELGSGFEELYRLSLPKTAAWSTSSPVPYAQHAPHGIRSLDRVAYCLETVDASGTSKRAYASFDAFSSDTRDYDIPVRPEIIAQPVDNLTVIGDGVTPVTNADGGAIEFWPYQYHAASPSGLTSGAYDYSDTPSTAATYGSFQIHNARAKETVMAVNSWARSSWLDIGVGNRPSTHTDWTLSSSGQTMQSATLTAYVKPAEEERTAPSASAGCEAGVGELADYRLLYDLDVPVTSAAWRDADGVDYAVDNAAEIDAPISRVAYCLETQTAAGRQWSYASMNTWTQDLDALAVPETTSGAAGRSVSGLTVRGSTAGGISAVKPVDGGTGYLEMWRNQYGTAVPPGSPTGARGDVYDIADTPTAADGYGSFQVHDATNARTVLALNGWALATTDPLDVGIGQRPTSHPDWTFAHNRAQFAAVRLAVYVRPAGVEVTAAPTSHQLYPRDLATGAATVPVSGTISDPDIVGTQVIVRQGDTVVDTQTSVARTFSYTTSIPAEFAAYDVELWALHLDGRRTLIRSATDIVAGDAYIVQGQSNAVAAIYGNGPEYGSVYDRSTWVRTYGSPIVDGALSTADRTWSRTVGDAVDWQQSGYIGRLGTSLGRSLAERSGVPVAILTGGHGGKPSSFFQRDDAQPLNPATNYGRLLGRLEGSGVKDAIRAVVWYQGESDIPAPATYKSNMEALLADWDSDLSDLEQTYMVQIREGCGGGAIGVQEVQRQFDARPDITVMTTSGLDNHDGCHYGYEKGYRQLGQWLAAPIARDTAGVPTSGPVTPPAPASFSWANPGRTSIAIALTDPTRSLSCEPGAVSDFRLGGTTARITGLTCGPGTVTLSLNAAAPAATTISYVGHTGAVGASTPTITDTAWITDSTGMGLLAFGPQPIPPAAAVVPRCGDIAELSGFEELYRLTLPKTAAWSVTSPVPYAQHAPHSVRALDRVAFCLETVDSIGTVKRAYTSFDAFSSDTRDYDIPVRPQVIAQPVDNLTVIGDGVTPVTNADGGAIEFWPYAYTPVSPSGVTPDVYDHSDTPLTTGMYGSFQIHNVDARETVMAVNSWARSSWLDIGIGNRPSTHTDWTLSSSGQTMQSATLTAYVKPAD